MIIGRAEAGQQDSQKERDGCGSAVKLPQPYGADHDKGKIRNNVPEIRRTEQCALIGELVIGLILRDRRHQEQSAKRRDHQTEDDPYAAVSLRAIEHC